MFATHAMTFAHRTAKKTIGYTFTALPSGILDVALSTGAGAATISSNALREGARTSGSGTFWSAALMPDLLATSLVSVTVTNAAQSSSSRGIGAGVFSADGTKGVLFIVCGNTTAAAIFSWVGGVLTPQDTASGKYSTSSSDQLTIVPTVSGGVVTWDVYKTGTALGLSWTDKSHVVDLPGNRAAACFRHEYSGGEFYSPGIKALSASDL